MFKGFLSKLATPTSAFLHARPIAVKYQIVLFWAAVVLFLFLQTGLVVQIYSNRALPPEADDVYTYILKAVELRDCFIQDCRALESLRSQVAVPSLDLSPHGTSMSRDRAAHRTLMVYHPLHSLLLDLIQAVGTSWEQAYYFLALLGSIFLALAIAFWLRYLFGPGIAGVAMLILANFSLQGQGVTFIVPSNLDLAFFLLLWATILQPEVKGSEWYLVLGAIVLLGMHTIGRLYIVILTYLYWSTHRGNLTPNKKIALASALGLTLAVLLLPQFVNHPVLATFPQSYPQIYPRNLELYVTELTTDVAHMKVALSILGNAAALVVLFIIGLSSGRKVNFEALLIFAGLTVISVIPSDPGYPGEIFERLWDPLLIVIVGFIAQGYWLLLSGIKDYWMRFRMVRASRQQWFMAVGTAVLVVLIAANVYYMLQMEMHFRQNYSNYAISREDYWFDQKQTEFISAQSPACGDILYFSEAARDYFLVHGALACGAIDYASVANSQEENQWIVNNLNLRFAVLFNPIVELASAHNGGIAVSLNQKLDISTSDDSVIPQNILLLLANQGAGNATVVAKVKGKPIANFVIGTGQHWVEITTVGSPEFILYSKGKRDQILIQGMKLTNDSSNLVWPWNSNLTLTTVLNNNQLEPIITFQQKDVLDLLPRNGQYELTVLMDQGDTVVMGIRRSASLEPGSENVLLAGLH